MRGETPLHKVAAKRATYIGLAALGMWAIEPLLISEVNGLPIFEVLAIIFFSSFLFTAYRLTIKKRWRQVLKQPILIWITGFIGICLSDFAYIYGAQHAPIAHVDLIDYLWPCLVVAFTSMLPNERLTVQHILGALLGLLGIFVLVYHQLSLEELSTSYFIGYLLAFLGAVLWGGYSAFSRYHKELPTEMIGMYCGLGGLLCLVLHFQFESFVMPTNQQGLLSVITGISGAGIAYQLWDYGVKHGNIYVLSSLTYVARLFAMTMLVLFGKEPFTVNLLLACVLTSLGVFITNFNFSALRDRLKKWFPDFASVSSVN